MLITDTLSKVIDSQQKKDLPNVSIGDIIQVKVSIKEGNKERLQQYEGTVIAKKSGNIITVRRVFQNIGIEYVFPMSAPQIASIVIKRNSKVRRSKLFYLRKRVGKRAQLKNKISSISV